MLILGAAVALVGDVGQELRGPVTVGGAVLDQVFVVLLAAGGALALDHVIVGSFAGRALALNPHQYRRRGGVRGGLRAHDAVGDSVGLAFERVVRRAEDEGEPNSDPGTKSTYHAREEEGVNEISVTPRRLRGARSVELWPSVTVRGSAPRQRRQGFDRGTNGGSHCASSATRVRQQRAMSVEPLRCESSRRGPSGTGGP